MFKNWNWKKIAQWIAIILGAIGGNQALEYATADDPPPSYEAPAPAAQPYEVAVAFSLPDGGGAFPAFQDDAGPAYVSVEKASRALIEQAFRDEYGKLYPGAKITGYRVIRGPDKGQEPEPEPEPDDELIKWK